MAESFKIRRGPAVDLFVDPSASILEREINKNLVIEIGCWYITSDTAELFVGVYDEAAGRPDLKRINGDEILALIKELNTRIDDIDASQQYQEIPDEYWLQGKLLEGALDPNVLYYVVNKDHDGNRLNTCSTYIVDTNSQNYFCTNNLDVNVIATLVSEAIDLQLSEKFAEMLPVEIDKAIQNIFANDVILHGGNA